MTENSLLTLNWTESLLLELKRMGDGCPFASPECANHCCGRQHAGGNLMSTRKRIALARWLILLVPIVGARAEEQSISVPPGTGNTFTLYPMRILQERVYSMRYQQVYAARAFAGVEPTNRFLTRLDLRVDEEAIYPISGTTTNLEIRLSTTSKSPDALSTAFAENNGSDEMLVYADTEPTYIRPNVDARLYIFILPKPFLYDAKKGELASRCKGGNHR